LVPIFGNISGDVFSTYTYPKMAEGRVGTFQRVAHTRRPASIYGERVYQWSALGTSNISTG
jgi:hypothetical protein